MFINTIKSSLDILKQVSRDKQFYLMVGLAFGFWFLLVLLVPTKVQSIIWVLEAPLHFSMLAILFPVVEELAFRGFIQTRLNRVLLQKYPSDQLQSGFISSANLITSIVFVIFHFLSHSLFWATAVIVPSLIFGYFRDKYNSVWPSIILHIIFNSGYFLLYPPL